MEFVKVQEPAVVKEAEKETVFVPAITPKPEVKE